MKNKKYLFCPYCPKMYELTFTLRAWTGMRCESCGGYFVIAEQEIYTEQELLEAQNV